MPIEKMDILSGINEDLGKESNPILAYESFKNLVDIAQLMDFEKNIELSGKKNDHLSENIYLVDRLIETAKEKIRIFTKDIDDCIYGNPTVSSHIKDWLRGDPSRKVLFLLNDGSKYKHTSFYRRMRDEFLDGKILVKRTGSEKYSPLYVAVFDNKSYKAKKISSPDFESIWANFNCPEVAEKISLQFDLAFNSNSDIKESVWKGLFSTQPGNVIDTNKFSGLNNEMVNIFSEDRDILSIALQA